MTSPDPDGPPVLQEFIDDVVGILGRHGMQEGTAEILRIFREIRTVVGDADHLYSIEELLAQALVRLAVYQTAFEGMVSTSRE